MPWKLYGVRIVKRLNPMKELTGKRVTKGCVTMTDLDVVKDLQLMSAEFRQSGLFQSLSTLLDSASEVILKNIDERRKLWIPVSERLPDNEKIVQVCVAIKANGKTIRRKIVQAFHTDGKTPVCASAYSWEYNDGCEEWSDEQNDFVVSEAWWESVSYSDEFSIISDFVTHWRELPELPKECG